MADGQPTYSQTLVSYIDILGFADLIKDSQTSTDGVREIIRLLTTMKDEFSIGGRVHRRPDGRTEKIFQSFNFSDLIVRTTRIPAGADICPYQKPRRATTRSYSYCMPVTFRNNSKCKRPATKK